MTKQTQQEDGRRLHLIVGDRVDMSQWKRLAVHDENFTQPIGLDRRSALKLMGASAALALGVPGCKRKPERQIVSRHSGPEYQKPGKVLAYSSTWTEGNFPYGMIVNVVDGRPVKIEGNPDHPVNGTATNGAMQASILSLYDPARMQAPVKGAQPVEWGLVDNEIISALDAAQSVALLTRATLGPAQRELVKQFVAAKPGAKHLVYESVHDGPRRSAWKKIFGQDGELVPDYAKAQVILSLGCDFLGTEPTAVQATGEFAQGRNVVAQGPNARINRLYVAEAAMTTTGSNADHRLRIKPSALPGLITALSDAVAGDNEPLKAVAAEQHLDAALLKALAGDLVGHQGQSVIVADGQLPEAVHAAVALLNDTLGNIGKTLTWNSQPAALAVNTQEEIAATLDGGVDVLICLGVNPVYDWAGGGFETILKKARLSIGHGLYANETVTACTIGLPSCHNLESWNDAVAAAGVRVIRSKEYRGGSYISLEHSVSQYLALILYAIQLRPLPVDAVLGCCVADGKACPGKGLVPRVVPHPVKIHIRVKKHVPVNLNICFPALRRHKRIRRMLFCLMESLPEATQFSYAVIVNEQLSIAA